MIIKKIIFKRQNKSSFKNLSKYILDEDNNHAKVLTDYILDNKNNMDKVEAYHFTNCSFDDNKDNIKEIITTQKLNTITKQDKTIHLVVSFKEDESPDIKILYAIEDEIAAALGMKDHQRLSAVHSNTNNLHIHIAINKVNPNTLKVVNPYNDVKILQELAIKLEKKYNLQIDNHISSNNVKENKYNKHTMTCNFENWVKEKITNTVDIMLKDEKTSFNDLKLFLAKYDLEFRERRKGFVISSKTEKLFCKASSIHRNLSKQSLEKRYGQLDLSALKENLQEISVSEKYNKFNGMSPNPLYQNYLNYEKQKLELREKELRMLKLKRNEFKNSISSMKFNNLTINHIKNQKAIFKNKTKEIYQRYKKISYRQFLINEAYSGNEEAIKALQNKEAKIMQNSDNTFKGNVKNCVFDKPDYITKEGYFVYQRNNQKIIDKNDHIKVISSKKDDTVLLEALTLAMKKYDNLTLSGNSEFKNKIINLVVKHDLDIKFKDKLLNQMVRNLRIKNIKVEKNIDQNLTNF
ncbi:hypothetical protein AWR29_08475 [Campylobacter fetus subsp. venerealis]|nr:hypothetical protein AWR29_08475 [Campylobacter fetus subsp. venerealis]